MTEPHPAQGHVLRRDGAAVVETLSRAFFDDPLTRWLLGDGADFAARIERWMQFAVETGLAHGHLYASSGHRAVAIWSAPESSLFDPPWGQQMAELFSSLLGDAAVPRMKSMASLTSGVQPDEPHYYLFLLGTHPDARGEGLASALLDPILRACDAQGLAAHLESSNPVNVPFYQRHGFEVVSEVRPEPDGPVVHPMRRVPH